MEENMIVIRDPKNFCFNFDWPEDACGQKMKKDHQCHI